MELPLDSCIQRASARLRFLWPASLQLKKSLFNGKRLWMQNRKRVKGNKDGKRKARELREAHFTVTRKMYGEIKTSLCPTYPFAFLCTANIPEEWFPNFGFYSLLDLGMGLDEAVLYLFPAIKIALPWTEFVSSEHEIELWVEEISYFCLSWSLHCCPWLPKWHERLSQPQWSHWQTAVVFPLLGSFSNCGSPDTVLLQEAAKCSLSSSSRGRINPGGPVIFGDLLCHVNHWRGLQASSRGNRAWWESALSWLEPCGQTCSKLLQIHPQKMGHLWFLLEHSPCTSPYSGQVRVSGSWQVCQ